MGINYNVTTGGYNEDWVPKVSDIRQSGRIGNCWMLTALLTLIDNGKSDSIRDCFVNYDTFLNDKIARFKFFKLEFSYISWFNPFNWSANITIGDTVEIKVDNTIHKETNGSAVWVKLFEKAFAAYIAQNCISSTSCFRRFLLPNNGDVVGEKIDISKILSGSFPCFCRAAVTGIPEQCVKELTLNLCNRNDDILRLFYNCSENNIPLCFSVASCKKYTDIATNQEKRLQLGHSYSFLKYDSVNKRIYFRDPRHGSEERIIKFDIFCDLVKGFIFGLKQFDKQKERFE